MGNNSATQLLAGIEAIEEIEDQIAELKERIKGLNGERKLKLDDIRSDTGFHPKVTEQLLRERRMDEGLRHAFAMQLQVGRATLGMLDGTPLGDAARKSFEKRQGASETRGEDYRQEPFAEIPDEPGSPAMVEPTEERIEAARREGAASARAGGKIIDNPYPADPAKLRAAWDEGYCGEAGSDGMEIPEELRRKPKKANDDEAGEEEDTRRAA